MKHLEKGQRRFTKQNELFQALREFPYESVHWRLLVLVSSFFIFLAT